MNPAPMVVANRGPVSFVAGDVPPGYAGTRRGAGGLVTAVGPAMAEGAGVWIAACGDTADRAARRAGEAAGGRTLRIHLPQGGVRLRLVDVPEPAYDSYYNHVANQVLWPLLHQLYDTAREPLFDDAFREHWQRYRAVNTRFAGACAQDAPPGGEVFVQDYHLALVPAMLRERRPDLSIAHYTHCPWVDPDGFALLPDDVARELLTGMLGADLLCFEVERWRHRFLSCCAAAGYEVEDGVRIVLPSRSVQTGSYPLGVDAVDLCAQASSRSVAAERDRLDRIAGQRRAVVRVDRLEPSKNILRGLEGFRALLRRRPDLHGDVVHLVFAYESRLDVPQYREYGRQVRSAAAAINDTFGSEQWKPVYLETRDSYPSALAAMGCADVIVVNPLRDGQNLVAKEAPLLNERQAPLILSRQAGAADDLAVGALMVNPLDTAQLADALEQALAMPAEERIRRHKLVCEAAVAGPPQDWFARQRIDLRTARGS